MVAGSSARLGAGLEQTPRAKLESMTAIDTPGDASGSALKWAGLAYHRLWLIDQAKRLFDFYEPHLIDPAGGFAALDDIGEPIALSGPGGSPAYELPGTTRMVHCFAIARLMGRPGAAAYIDHGMDFLWRGHRDA